MCIFVNRIMFKLTMSLSLLSVELGSVRLIFTSVKFERPLSGLNPRVAVLPLTVPRQYAR